LKLKNKTIEEIEEIKEFEVLFWKLKLQENQQNWQWRVWLKLIEINNKIWIIINRKHEINWKIEEIKDVWNVRKVNLNLKQI
jgi:hypothetical protein